MGDDISVNISGTLQGGSDLLKSIEHWTIYPSPSQALVKRYHLAIWPLTLMAVAQSQIYHLRMRDDIYAGNGFTVSAQNIQNGEITNEATGTISGARLAILVNGSSDSTLTNAGTIAVNNDNITYRDNLTLSRNSHTDGQTIWAETADNLTITNSGTISSITKETSVSVSIHQF